MTGSTGQRVLGIHPGALGDVILFARRLANLGGPVTLVCRSAVGRLLGELGVVAGHLSFDDLPWEAVFAEGAAGGERLAQALAGHDRLISCYAEGDSSAQQRLAQLAGTREADVLPIRPPAEFDGHLVDLWTRRLAADPVDASPWPVAGGLRAAAAEAVGRLGLDADRPVAWLHPGAGSEGKCWSAHRFGELADGLYDAGYQPAMVVGPVELDRWPSERFRRLRASAPTWESPSLVQLAGALAGACVFVGNDSGPAHLAAAVGCPTLALFGPTRARHFAPVGPCVRTIETDDLAGLAVAEVAAQARAMVTARLHRGQSDCREAGS